MRGLERQKQFIRDHVSEKMKCETCFQMVDSIWYDGIVERIPVKHECTQTYKYDIVPDSESGELFSIEVVK